MSRLEKNSGFSVFELDGKNSCPAIKKLEKRGLLVKQWELSPSFDVFPLTIRAVCCCCCCPLSLLRCQQRCADVQFDAACGTPHLYHQACSV